MGVQIPINPQVLKWARETAGYSLEELESSQGLSKFGKWENGELSPTYPQLEKIAGKLHRPVALFFYPAPPEEEMIEKSLRAISEEDVQNLSPLIRQLFRKAKAFQISLRELWQEEREDHEKRISWLTTLESDSPELLAVEVRNIFQVSVEEQATWRDADDALKKWRDILADYGIYVFKDAFRNERIAGFCIYDDLYPIIYLNNSLTKNRQIFTMFHELAHLVFRDSYLDIFDEVFWQLESKQPQHIEVKCNAFAGEFLVPGDDFRDDIEDGVASESQFSQWAEKYHVSREVILRRLLTYDFISKRYFEEQIRVWSKRYEESQKAKNKGGGGDYYNTKMAYLGDAYLNLVLKNYSLGNISVEQAASHLDVKVKTFPNIEEKFMMRGAFDVRV